MKWAVLSAILLISVPAWAFRASGGGGSSGGGGGGGGSGYTDIQDEGVDLVKRSSMNFVGAGVSAADSGGVTTITIPGGGSGGMTPGNTNYIQNTSSLQSGATFYVSSGTVDGQFTINSIPSTNFGHEQSSVVFLPSNNSLANVHQIRFTRGGSSAPASFYLLSANADLTSFNSWSMINSSGQVWNISDQSNIYGMSGIGGGNGETVFLSSATGISSLPHQQTLGAYSSTLLGNWPIFGAYSSDGVGGNTQRFLVEHSSTTTSNVAIFLTTMTLSGGRIVQNIIPLNGQVLKFDGTNWAPGVDSTGGSGGATIWVKKNAVALDNSVSTLNVITTSGLTATSSPSGQVNIGIDTTTLSGLVTNSTAATGAFLSLSSATANYLTLSSASQSYFPINGSIAANKILAGSLGASVIASSFPVTGVTAASYTNTNLTVNAQGMITAASNGTGGGGSSVNISSGPTFASTNTVTLTNSTTETSLRGIGYGSSTFTANSFYVGETILVNATGLISDAAVAQGTLTIKFKLGGTAIAVTSAFTPTANQSNSVWNFTAFTTIRSLGASGSVILNTSFIITDSLGITQDVYPMLNSGPITIDTTKSNDFDLTAQWGTASGSNIISCTNWIADNFNGNAASTATAGGSSTVGGNYVVQVASNGVLGAATDFNVYASSVVLGSTYTFYPSTIVMGTPIALPNSPLNMGMSANNPLQVNLQNTNSGTIASSDFVATSNLGTNTSFYVNLGINSSGNADPNFTMFSSSDSYLYAANRNLNIGTAENQTFAALQFFTGGTLAANKRMTIDNIGGVTVVSGSMTIQNSSGWAVNNSTFVVNIATNIIQQANGNNFLLYQSSGVFNSVDLSTNSSNLQNIPGYQFQIAPGETWAFDANLYVTGITNGTELGFNGPAGSTVTMVVNGNTSAVTAFSINVVTALNTADSVAFVTSNGTALMIRAVGTIQNAGTGAAGSANLMWKSVTNGNTSTIKAGSSMMSRRIN